MIRLHSTVGAMSYQKLPCTPTEPQQIILQYWPKGLTEISQFDWIQLVGLNDRKVCTTPGPTVRQRLGPCLVHAPHPLFVASDAHLGICFAAFTHSVCTRANSVKFTHQSLCNPKISTLLKAVRKRFLKGRPNMSEKVILKYLNPSLATAKGHMKFPPPWNLKHPAKTNYEDPSIASCSGPDGAPCLTSDGRSASVPWPCFQCLS